MVSSVANLSLIAQIYDSIGQAGAVEETMSAVSGHLGARAAFWYVLPRGASHELAHNPFLFNGFRGFHPDNIKTFNDEMWRHDYALKHASVTNRTTETHELISPEDAARSDYVNWLTREEGIDRRIARSTDFSNGTVAGWAFHMPAGVERRPAERVNFDVLAPHLRQMFRLTSLFGEAHAQRDALDAVIRNLEQAVVLLEVDGAIRWVSEAALSLSAHNDGLSCDGPRLAFARSNEQRDFDRMLALARQPDLTGGAGTIGQMLVGRPSGKRPYALQLAPAPTAFRRQFHGRCAFILTIRDTAGPTDPRPELWRALFGLTPTEARVAGLSMRGLDDAAIAGALGLGIGTVRTHHKHLLSKTETHSKAELAHLLTSLA